ncbi:Purine-cytosine permease [Sesbania bispinosa]|nr:Purine-cytosine permease [Sesbania bispinosa]
MVSNCLTLHVPHHPTSPFLTSKNPKPSHSSIHLSFPSNFIKDFHAPYNSLAKNLPMKCSNSSIPITSPDFEFESDPTLTNEDLKPTTPSQRTFSGLEMASLWVGLVVGVPSYYLAGSLVDLGMAWWQGIATVVIGNMILLVPLILTGHPGTRYGISFPVLARSSFGIHGAHIPTLLRALVGCGWYGIESWIGGEAIFLLLPKSVKETSLSYYLPWLGLATITTNIAANVVAPANALVNLNPKWFTFRRGALLTALLGIVFQPWRLLKSSESFIYTWLVGYSALMGPIGGIVLADYYLIQKTNLSISDLYSRSP